MDSNMNLKFRVSKAVSAIITLFGYGRNNHCMKSQKLLAFLYIFERRRLTRWAHVMIGDTYISTSDGPVLKTVKQLIESDTDDLNPKVVAYWNKYIISLRGCSGYMVQMRNPETIFIDHNNGFHIISRDPLVIEHSIPSNHMSLSSKLTLNKVVLEDHHRIDPAHAPDPYNTMDPRPEGITDPVLMRQFSEWDKDGGIIKIDTLLQAVGWSEEESYEIMCDMNAYESVDAVWPEDYE